MAVRVKLSDFLSNAETLFLKAGVRLPSIMGPESKIDSLECLVLPEHMFYRHFAYLDSKAYVSN